MRKIDEVMNSVQDVFSRKNVYFFTFILLLILLVVYVFNSEQRGNIKVLVFNPFWPIILVIFELFIQNFEKEKARENENKINSAGSVVRTAQKTSLGDEVVNRLLLEALNGDNLIEKGIEEQKMRELDEKTKKAGSVEKKRENVDTF